MAYWISCAVLVFIGYGNLQAASFGIWHCEAYRSVCLLKSAMLFMYVRKPEGALLLH